MRSRTRRWTPTVDPSVTIAEERGVRFLHLGGMAIQSAMRLSAPDALELHYTRAMMSFLLFCPRPRRVLMIGLGGGSIARFMRQRLPETELTVVEIRPEVVAAARAFFDLPPEEKRFRIVVGDGAAHVVSHPRSANVLLVDGFDDGRQPAALCSQAFYDAACASLRPGGVLAVNFMAHDPKREAFLARIERSFQSRVLLVDAADRVNVIALALRGGPPRITWSELAGRAAALAALFELPFERFVASIRTRSGANGRFLDLASGAREPA